MKKIVIFIMTILFIAIIFLGVKYLTKKEYITEEEAKEIATKDVSNRDNEYFFNSVEFSEINDNYIYTLVFTDKVNTYTYKINALNKKIISSKKESLNNNKVYLKDSEILNIVFKHAKLNKSDCNIISNLVTLEDGMPTYNTIFYNNDTRYEYKINGYTGSIISVFKLKENAS